MRLALWQGASDAGNARAILARVAGEAAREGAALLLLPEMFATGYAIGADAAGRLAETSDGQFFVYAADIARRNRIALGYGYPERGADARVFNAAQIVGPDGAALLRYRKTHLFGDLDRGMFSAGDALGPVVEFGGLRIALLICYDVEFPEAVRVLALAGADLVLVPTALMVPFDCVARLLVPARALESQVFVAYCNRIGAEGELVYCGQSCIACPDGADGARAGVEETLLVADLDPAALAASRAAMPYLRDRRAGLYAATSSRSCAGVAGSVPEPSRREVSPAKPPRSVLA